MTQASGNSILLVEDDHLLRGAFRLLLEDAGYNIQEASNRAEALASIEREIPTLILLDLGLPDGPGLDLARTLKEETATAGIPIVALTGHAGEEDRLACIGAGCASYLAKPVEPKLLLSEVASILITPA